MLHGFGRWRCRAGRRRTFVPRSGQRPHPLDQIGVPVRNVVRQRDSPAGRQQAFGNVAADWQPGVGDLVAGVEAAHPVADRLDHACPPYAEDIRELWLVVHADLRRAPAIRAVMDFVATLVAESSAFSPEP